MYRRTIILTAVLAFSVAHPNPDSNATPKDGEPLIVTTPMGQIQGSVIQSRLGKPIYSFRGIRYAKAPKEELRFQVSNNLICCSFDIIKSSTSTTSDKELTVIKHDLKICV